MKGLGSAITLALVVGLLASSAVGVAAQDATATSRTELHEELGLDVRELEWAPLKVDDATFGPSARLVDIAASDSMLVIGGSVGSSAAVWTSTDRLNWKRVPHDEKVFGGPADQEIKAIVPWRDGFVAAGEVGGVGDFHRRRVAAVWVSEDGTTWTRVPHDEMVFGGKGRQEMFDIAATDDRLAIVGFDEQGPCCSDRRADHDIAVWTSADGFDWKKQTFGGGEMLAVEGTSEGFLGVGHRGVWTSANGTRWERTAPSDVATDSTTLLGVVPTRSGFVAVGEQWPLGPAAWTSRDGATWATAGIDDAIPDGDVVVLRAVASGHSGLAAVAGPGDTGGDSAIIVSPDGGIWTQGLASADVADGCLGRIASFGSHFVAIGPGRTRCQAPSSIWTTFEHGDTAPAEPAGSSEPAVTTLDLLPGVALVTEEVEPGVLQVISDGERDLSIPVFFARGPLDRGRLSKVVVAPDESVWVFGPQEFFRVGEGTAHEGKPWSVVDVDADGTVWALLEPGADDYDGYGDYRHKNLSTFDGEQWLRKARKVVDFELHPDGETFIVVDSNDGSSGPGLQASIGPVHDDAWEDVGVVEPWKWGGMAIGEGYGGFAISPRATPGEPYPRYIGWAVDGRGLLSDIQFDPSGDGGGAGCCSTEGRVVGLGYGSDGTSWVRLRFDLPVMTGDELTTESAYFLARYDASDKGSPRATYESESIPGPDHGPLDGEIATHLDVAPDGSVWLPSDDGLARFDGRTWMWFLRGNIIEDVDVAPDGTVWVQANDLGIGPQSPPPSDQDPTTKTYVITPEAVTDTE